MMFPGIYRGKVYSNSDPSRLKRLRLVVPKIFGESPTKWAAPSAPSNISVTPPPVGAQVWVMFEGGDPDYPVWISG